jgi:hypothetical protein
MIFFQLLQKFATQLLPLFPEANPNLFKINFTHEILGDCHGIINVKDSMPPPSWDEDCLSYESIFIMKYYLDLG